MPFLIIALLILVILVLVLVIVGRRAQNDVDPLEARLAEYGDREMPSSLEELEMSLSLQDRVIVPLYNSLAGLILQFTPERQIQEVATKIDRAGLAGKVKPTTFFGQRVALTLAFGAGAFVLFFFFTDWPVIRAFIATAVGAALGYYLPMLQLSSKISKRQRSVIRNLPDALDLMVVCVEAGLSFDGAMSQVYEKWENEVALAFGRILQEIQLGKLRRDALRDMSNRLDVPDFTTFASAIIQADQLGVSIGKILRIQSEQMRVKRRQRAQEKAQQAPVKMMIPLTFFIFPAIWIVLLGPSAITVMNLGTF